MICVEGIFAGTSAVPANMPSGSSTQTDLQMEETQMWKYWKRKPDLLTLTPSQPKSATESKQRRIKQYVQWIKDKIYIFMETGWYRLCSAEVDQLNICLSEAFVFAMLGRCPVWPWDSPLRVATWPPVNRLVWIRGCSELLGYRIPAHWIGGDWHCFCKGPISVKDCDLFLSPQKWCQTWGTSSAYCMHVRECMRVHMQKGVTFVFSGVNLYVNVCTNFIFFQSFSGRQNYPTVSLCFSFRSQNEAK